MHRRLPARRSELTIPAWWVPAGFPSDPAGGRDNARDARSSPLSRRTVPAGDAKPQPPAPDPKATFFEHSNTSKWWFSGQANFVFQAHGDFYAQYSGTNSFTNPAEHATSRVLTFFSGYEFSPNTMAYLDVEEAGGSGLSTALGLAGFTNLDVVRNPSIGTAPYIARLMIQQIIPLSKEKMEVERTALSLATQVPVRRLEIRFGKFGLSDFFDLNVGGADSHYQFLNWVIANNGAYDYAADTRGYTIGAIFDYEDRNWGLRFAETLMPKVANGAGPRCGCCPCSR